MWLKSHWLTSYRSSLKSSNEKSPSTLLSLLLGVRGWTVSLLAVQNSMGFISMMVGGAMLEELRLKLDSELDELLRELRKEPLLPVLLPPSESYLQNKWHPDTRSYH